MRNKRTNTGRSASQGRELASELAVPCEMSPYNFVPILPELALSDSPVTHERYRIGEDYFSGTLFIELTPLTPLAAMSKQFTLEQTPEAAKFDEHFIQRFRNNLPSNAKTASDKKLLQPLTLTDDENGEEPGPLLLAASSLKGCLRNGIQTLLSAPIERVQERQFTFRPHSENAELCVPAIVTSTQHEDGLLTSLTLVPLKSPLVSNDKNLMNRVIFVDQEVEARLAAACNVQLGKPSSTSLDELSWDDRKSGFSELTVAGAVRPSPGLLTFGKMSGDSCVLRNVILLRYRSGLDGDGTLQKAFEQQNSDERKRTYRWVLLSLDLEVQNLPQALSNTLRHDDALGRAIASYVKTRQVLGDRAIGHMREHPLKKSLDEAAIRDRLNDWSWPAAGDLMFIEYGTNNRVTGLGHHFRHRRVYRDSIHCSADPKIADGAKVDVPPKLRNLLRPLPLEVETNDDAGLKFPKRLSAARSLFGYIASDSKGNQKGEYNPDRPNQPMTYGLGMGDAAQLMGRVAFNHAVEQQRDDADRFINSEFGCLVPLKPAGTPKPSAVEMYLTQDRITERDSDGGRLCTYGDKADDPAAGDLRGRKVYYHQPDAARDSKVYELHPDDRKTWCEGENEPFLLTQFSPVAKYVLTPGSRLRCALRLTNLRLWELGAIFLALECRNEDISELIKMLGLSNDLPGLQELLVNTNSKESHGFAIKIGHGKAIGLGSVAARVQAAERLSVAMEGLRVDAEDIEVLRYTCLDAFANYLRGQLQDRLEIWAAQVFLPWLRVHQFHGAKGRRDYPRMHGQITAYHTAMRREHARSRKEDRNARKENKTDTRTPLGLKPL